MGLLSWRSLGSRHVSRGARELKARGMGTTERTNAALVVQRLLVARPAEPLSRACHRKCVRRLRAALLLVLVGLPFKPLRQSLVTDSDYAHPPSCVRVFHRVGSRQHLFGAHSQVARAQQKLVDFF